MPSTARVRGPSEYSWGRSGGSSSSKGSYLCHLVISSAAATAAIARTEGTLDAELRHTRTPADGAAAAPEVAGDEEQGGGEGGEQEPREDRTSLQFAAPLLVIRGAEGDVAGVLVVLQRGRSRR